MSTYSRTAVNNLDLHVETETYYARCKVQGNTVRHAVGQDKYEAIKKKEVWIKKIKGVHGELPFKQRLAVQTTRGSGFASGNSQGWRVEGLGRPLSPRACRRIALGGHAPRCRTF